MSTQEELNAYNFQYVLYYCGSEQKDNTVYNIYCSDVCTASFDESGNFQIDSWLLSGYAAPNMKHLLTFALVDVQTWYNNFYVAPSLIADCQYYKISTDNLDLVRTDDDMIGYRVFDTTSRTVKSWTGRAWENQ
jgi:hypothetical protein